MFATSVKRARERALSRGTYSGIKCESDVAVCLSDVISVRVVSVHESVDDPQARRPFPGGDKGARGSGQDIYDPPGDHENEGSSRKQRQREKQDTSHDDSEHSSRPRGDPKKRGSGHHNSNSAEAKRSSCLMFGQPLLNGCTVRYVKEGFFSARSRGVPPERHWLLYSLKTGHLAAGT